MIQTHLGEEFLRFLIGFLPVDAQRPSHLMTKHDVFADAEIGAQVNFLIHGGDARVLRITGTGEGLRLASTSMEPALILYTPVSALIIVDFPAPFSPMRAWTSPGYRRRSTPSRALTPGNSIVIPFITTIGCLSTMSSPYENCYRFVIFAQDGTNGASRYAVHRSWAM